MSVQDTLKKSFLEGFQNTNLSMQNVAIMLLIAGLVGIYLFFIYRIMTVNTFYSKRFNISLILMCIITAAIIVTIQSSIVVSLGMVGALSIVRFRTAVKEPLDLTFMFWSISVGIICGAGMPGLAVMLSLVATAVILLFNFFPEVRPSMILVVNAENNECAGTVFQTIGQYNKHYEVKSRNITESSADFVIEIRLKDYEELIQELSEIAGVLSVSVVSHKGNAVC